nr:LPS-assembly protein LptD [Bacteroidota bacterium]
MRITSTKTFFILVSLLISVTSAGFAFESGTAADTVIKSTSNNAFLKEKVHYSADDSMLVDMVNQKAYLYGNAQVIYEDLKLNAGFIEIDFEDKLVRATGIKDSLGKDTQKPVFVQGEDKFTAGSITYNFDTKKGKIKDVITQQGEGYIHGSDIKKDTNNVYYVSHGKYTTCNLEHPHYYIGAKKIKVIPNDKIITGPADLYIADIPTPLAIPFGYFPNKKGRASGILLPTYGESANLGFFLRDGGFYFGANEFIDLALRGDIYSNGSFGAKANTNYRKRYRYNGGLNVSYSRIIQGDAELPNSIKRNDFFITWNHAQDIKAHPSSRFSASVNAGSSSFNKYNGNVTGDYLSNTFQSNIAYSKSFLGTPFNFSANARHSQNTITKKIDISLPELALSMNRIYPFKNNTISGHKWYDKVGISATANARNDINTYDSLLFKEQTLQEMRNGVRLNVPISTSLNVMKYFILTPSINFSSNIYFKTLSKYYDPIKKIALNDTIEGLRIANDYSTSVGLSTRLYGDYFFRTKHLKQIRHVATPTLSASYRPDFSESQYGYY